MSFPKIFIVIVIFSSLLLFSCSEAPSSIGLGPLEQDLVGVLLLDSEKDSLNQTSDVYKQVITLSGGERLLLGKKDNVESGILIKFLFFLADSIITQLDNNEITVNSAYVKLTQNYTFGDSLNSLDYSVHKINSSWSTGFSTDSLPNLMFDDNDISSNKTFSDSVNTFNFDAQLAHEWLKSISDTNSALNKGIYIKPTSSSQKIVGFQALSVYDVPIPYVYVVIEKSGTYVDTLSFYPSLDLSVVSGSIADVGTGNIAIQGGLYSDAKIYFDLSNLPKEIVINNAQLTLTLDSSKTVVGTSYTDMIRVNYLTDSAALAFDSTLSLYLNRSSNQFIGSISPFIQRAVNENKNQGLLISAGDVVDGVELFAIKSSSNSDFLERPKLQISYTKKR